MTALINATEIDVQLVRLLNHNPCILNHISVVAKLQQEDGSFAGDEWGEIDTRFSCIILLHLFCGSLFLTLSLYFVSLYRHCSRIFGDIGET